MRLLPCSRRQRVDIRCKERDREGCEDDVLDDIEILKYRLTLEICNDKLASDDGAHCSTHPHNRQHPKMGCGNSKAADEDTVAPPAEAAADGVAAPTPGLAGGLDRELDPANRSCRILGISSFHDADAPRDVLTRNRYTGDTNTNHIPPPVRINSQQS